jgi:predicted dehydrogenase
MKIAMVGCGFVADYYMQSLPDYPGLELAAVVDRDAARLAQFASYYRLDCARPALESVLADRSIELVLNLTNPDEHYAVSRQCLLAGKHVYSEKPLAMRFEDARDLYEIAQQRGLSIACAPCSVLGETAQGIWRALRDQRVGPVRLVYAELDDGLVQKMRYKSWISNSGRPWPYKDEFEVGCTLEHAGYYVNWLVAYFGPATSINVFATSIYPDKGTDVPLDRIAPDFSVACIQFESGVVARLTCSIVARKDQRLRFFGEAGILQVDDAWDYRAPIHRQRYVNIRRAMVILPFGRERLPARPYGKPSVRGAHAMHFCRGPAEMVAALQEKRRSHIPADFCLHANEISLAIHDAMEKPGLYKLTTRFEPIEPMPWAVT